MKHDKCEFWYVIVGQGNVNEGIGRLMGLIIVLILVGGTIAWALS